MLVLSHFSRVQLYATLWTVACPQWDSPSKNTGVGCHALLQGIFLTHELNPCLLHPLHCRQILYCGATGEAPRLDYSRAILMWNINGDVKNLHIGSLSYLLEQKEYWSNNRKNISFATLPKMSELLEYAKSLECFTIRIYLHTIYSRIIRIFYYI